MEKTSYEKFEQARDEYETAETEGLRPSPEEAWDYLDATIAAHRDGYIFSDQLYFVWQRVRPYLMG